MMESCFLQVTLFLLLLHFQGCEALLSNTTRDKEAIQQDQIVWSALDAVSSFLSEGEKDKTYHDNRMSSPYKATKVKKTDGGITALLVTSDKRCISPLSLRITYETNARVRMKITDPKHRRFEVPYYWYDIETESEGDLQYAVELTEFPFSVSVRRLDDDTVVFDSSSHSLVFQDQFLSLGTLLPSNKLYGIGEDSAPLLRDLDHVTHTLWTSGGYYEQGQGVNLYGAHPFYLNVEDSGKANGVLLMNSNAMDLLLSPSPPAVQWNTIGGVLDFTVFLGHSPLDVAKSYSNRIGRPFLPPMWSLGYHLCRWGYNNTGHMRAVLDSMIDESIPVDTQWNDIDYMDQHKDFTYDKVRYRDLPKQTEYLHSLGKRHVLMIDPGILAKFGDGYPPADTGLQNGVFVRNSTGNLLIGKVWPGETVFPDFLFPQTWPWWSKWLSDLHDEIPFDGIWIDMNEPQSFYDGSRDGCEWDNKLESPPYPTNARHGLHWQTLCLAAQHGAYLHYDVHNLYGWSEAMSTHIALKELRPGNRTFILSRSTFVGSGQWTAHWTGDVHSTWEDMRATIPHIINMNIFGIPMVGADICGFEGNSNRELCIRWSQLGAYYPFSRNHNTFYGTAQEPTAWDTEATDIIRDAITQRYRLLLYWYALFVKSHEEGDPVVQGLFMQFPSDAMSAEKDRQYMVGRGVMVCPTLEQGAQSTWIYFPPSLWYNIWSLALVSRGQEVVPEYPAPLHSINVFARGGNIIPMAMWTDGTVPSAEGVLAGQDISIYCYLDADGQASGHLVLDDGNSDNPDRETHRISMSVQDKQLTVTTDGMTSDRFIKRIRRVAIGGISDSTVLSVFLNHDMIQFNYTWAGLGILDIPLNDKNVTTGADTVIIAWTGMDAYEA